MTANMTLIATDGSTYGQPSQYPVTVEAGSGASDTLYLKGGNAVADSWFTGWKGLEVVRLENAGGDGCEFGRERTGHDPGQRHDPDVHGGLCSERQ